nr:DUF262 domain-containing protein [Streptomyces sp. SID8378]
MRPDVRDLFDSLYRGYPVGALLLWKTNLTVPFKTAAVVQADKSAHQPLYLLDGQQRLTSLAWVYRPESKADGRLIDLRFDVRTEEFVNPSAIQSKDPLLFRVSTLLQENVQYHEVLRAAGVDYSAPQFGAWMQRLQKVHDIRKQEIAVITYESDDYEEVAELFARLNKGGRRLSKGDLVYSAIAARWSDGLDTMDAFHQELQDSNFALNREAVLRLTSLLAGTGAHHIKLIGADMDEAALKEAWHATERALRFAIDFLKGECAIPRSEVLSSPNVTIVPALLLHHRDGKLRPGEAQLLRRWVYTAMAFSHYSLQVEGKLDSEARLIKSREGEGLFAELIRRTHSPGLRHPVPGQRPPPEGPGAEVLHAPLLQTALYRRVAGHGAGLGDQHRHQRPADEQRRQDRIPSRLPARPSPGDIRERGVEQPRQPCLRHRSDEQDDLLRAARRLHGGDRAGAPGRTVDPRRPRAAVPGPLPRLPGRTPESAGQRPQRVARSSQLRRTGHPPGHRRAAWRRAADRGGPDRTHARGGRDPRTSHEARCRDPRGLRRPARRRLLRSPVARREDPLRSGTRRVRDSQRGGGRRGPRPEPARKSESERMELLDRHRNGTVVAEHSVVNGPSIRLPTSGLRAREV